MLTDETLLLSAPHHAEWEVSRATLKKWKQPTVTLWDTHLSERRHSYQLRLCVGVTKTYAWERICFLMSNCLRDDAGIPSLCSPLTSLSEVSTDGYVEQPVRGLHTEFKTSSSVRDFIVSALSYVMYDLCYLMKSIHLHQVEQNISRWRHANSFIPLWWCDTAAGSCRCRSDCYLVTTVEGRQKKRVLLSECVCVCVCVCACACVCVCLRRVIWSGRLCEGVVMGGTKG